MLVPTPSQGAPAMDATPSSPDATQIMATTGYQATTPNFSPPASKAEAVAARKTALDHLAEISMVRFHENTHSTLPYDDIVR